MPWLAVPFKDDQLRSVLSRKFNVSVLRVSFTQQLPGFGVADWHTLSCQHTKPWQRRAGQQRAAQRRAGQRRAAQRHKHGWATACSALISSITATCCSLWHLQNGRLEAHQVRLSRLSVLWPRPWHGMVRRMTPHSVAQRCMARRGVTSHGLETAVCITLRVTDLSAADDCRCKASLSSSC